MNGAMDEDFNVVDMQFAIWAKALSHPARIAILRTLAAEQTCLCGQIVEELPLAQSTVSQHLKVLRDAGLVQSESSGTRSCYTLDAGTLQRVRAGVDQLLGALEGASSCQPVGNQDPSGGCAC